jgi:hypothetical protein
VEPEETDIILWLALSPEPEESIVMTGYLAMTSEDTTPREGL